MYNTERSEAMAPPLLVHSHVRLLVLQLTNSSLLLHLIFILILSSIQPSSALICRHGQCKLRDLCVRDSDCSKGLFCSTCVADGDILRRCHRSKATNLFTISSKGASMAFNKYSWLTTHNSFAIVGEKLHTSQSRITFENQEDSITSQLNNGVRGLMLDMYDFLGDIWLCHSFGGVCYNITSFEPAIDTLREIETFLATNPTEIITIFIEDYVRTPNGLTKLFSKSGLLKYWFPVSSMPKNGEDWPTVTDMVARNHRLLVFTSNRTKEASEGIAYNWKYVNENQYGNKGMQSGHCPNRGESLPLNATSRSLVLMNFFPDDPLQPQACKFNSDPLLKMLPTCYQAAGNRWPNYLAVDFYKRSDGGGTFAALDRINAGLMCGCSNINTCKLNLAYAMCNDSSENGNSKLPQVVPSSSDILFPLTPFIVTLSMTIHMTHYFVTL